MGSPGDLKLRHWVLISLPAVLCLAGWVTVQCFGGYRAVRLRGFTLKRVADLDRAESLAERCVGLDFKTAQRAFNDRTSWQRLVEVDWNTALSLDWGRWPAPGADGEAWIYRVDSGGSKVLLFVERGIVVGASGN